MIYKLVVQLNTIRAIIFAETLLASGGVGMLLTLLLREAKSLDMLANLSSSDPKLKAIP
jgi:hypothetical protein